MTLDVSVLLAPIAAETPAGIDLRASAERSGLYFALKERRAAARTRERQADAGADRVGAIQEWRTVQEAAVRLLAVETKDIEIAVWLTEAALRLDGFPGLRDGLLVLGGLVARYWPSLHSVDDETVSDKVAPIAGLNGLDAEGTLIQPLRLAALATAAGDEPAGLWLWQEARRRGPDSREAKRLAEAVRDTPRPWFAALSAALEECWRAFATLDAQLEAACGTDAPPLGTIRGVLQEARDALREMSGIEPPVPGPDPAEPRETTREAAAAEPARHPRDRIETREDALDVLARVARFFREHEPHSPIAYTLETLIRRARLPLAELLRELIPDEAVRRSALNMAGITLETPPAS